MDGLVDKPSSVLQTSSDVSSSINELATPFHFGETIPANQHDHHTIGHNSFGNTSHMSSDYVFIFDTNSQKTSANIVHAEEVLHDRYIPKRSNGGPTMEGDKQNPQPSADDWVILTNKQGDPNKAMEIKIDDNLHRITTLNVNSLCSKKDGVSHKIKYLANYIKKAKNCFIAVSYTHLRAHET